MQICTGCQRHVLATPCPFCGASRSRAPGTTRGAHASASPLIAGAALALGCGPANPPAQDPPTQLVAPPPTPAPPRNPGPPTDPGLPTDPGPPREVPENPTPPVRPGEEEQPRRGSQGEVKPPGIPRREMVPLYGVPPVD